MRKILHLADIHLSEFSTLGGRLAVTSGGHNQALADRLAAVRDLVLQAQAGGPLDGIVIAGDVFDRSRPTPLEVRSAGLLLSFMAKNCGARKVLIVAGNHDEPRNTSDPTALAGVEFAPFATVVDRAQLVEYAGMHFACLPYPRRSSFREGEGNVADPRSHYQSLLRALAHSLYAQAMSQGVEHDLLTLVFHGSVGGAVTGVQPRSLEGDIELAPDALDLYSSAMLGHIHKRQGLRPAADGSSMYWYSGSPVPTNFDEADEDKGACVWTLNCAHPTVEPLSLPAESRRPWQTLRLGDDVDTFIERVQALAAGGVYRLQGRGDEAEIRRIRGVVRDRVAAGLLIKDDLEVRRENRMRDASIAGEQMSDEAMLERALLARGVDPADVPRLLALHAKVQQGGAR